MAHRSRRRPAAQEVKHVAMASNGGQDRSPMAVPAPHWDNSQPLRNWYRDQLVAKIEELRHPRRAQLQRAMVPTLIRALEELDFDPSDTENNGGMTSEMNNQCQSAQAPTLAPITGEQSQQQPPQQQSQQQQQPQRVAPIDQTSPQTGQNGSLMDELDAKIRDAINQHLPDVVSVVISMVNNQRPSAPMNIQPPGLRGKTKRTG